MNSNIKARGYSLVAKLVGENNNIIGYRIMELASGICGDIDLTTAINYAKNEYIVGCKAYKSSNGKELLCGDGSPQEVCLSKIQSIKINMSNPRNNNKNNKDNVISGIKLLVCGTITYGIDESISPDIKTGEIVGYVVKNIGDKDIEIYQELYEADQNGLYECVKKEITLLTGSLTQTLPLNTVMLSKMDLARLAVKYGNNIFKNGKMVRNRSANLDNPYKISVESCEFSHYYFVACDEHGGKVKLPESHNILDKEFYERTKIKRVEKNPVSLSIFGYLNNKDKDTEDISVKDKPASNFNTKKSYTATDLFKYLTKSDNNNK